MASVELLRDHLKGYRSSIGSLTFEKYERFIEKYSDFPFMYLIQFSEEEQHGIKYLSLASTQNRIKEILGGDYDEQIGFMMDSTPGANLVLMKNEQDAVGLLLSDLILDNDILENASPSLGGEFFYCPYVPLQISP